MRKYLYPGQKVEFLSHVGYSNSGSGVTRLFQTVCKSVQERDWKKSGRFMSFSTYLKVEFEMASVILKPFLENRLNNLFVSGLGAYCLYDNAGCSALGLIEIVITGPLLKILATENHILSRSKHQKLFQKSFSMKVVKTVVGFLQVNPSVTFLSSIGMKLL